MSSQEAPLPPPVTGTQPDWTQPHAPKATSDRSVPFPDLVDARPRPTFQSPYDILDGASRLLGFMAWVVAIVGIIGGIAVAVIRDSSDDSTPYVGVGMGLAFSNLVFAAILYWMSTFGKAWANKNDPLA